MSTPKIMRAGGTIRRARFVKMDTSQNNTVLESDANERIVGISDVGSRVAPIPENSDNPPNAAIDDENVRVYAMGECCLLEAGDTITSGALLKSDADGKGVPLAETAGLKEECGARALEAGASGQLIKVQVCPMTVTTET